MRYLIVSTDDLCPGSMGLLKYWDFIKDKHPNFELTSFTVPFFWGRKENDIYRNEEFRHEMKDRPWIHHAQHGYRHDKPPEGTRFRKTQYSLFKRGFRKIRGYMPREVYGFKAPFYRINKKTLEVVKALGFSYLVQWDQVILFKDLEGSLPPFKIIPSHTNLVEGNPDDISKIYKDMEAQLIELEKTYTYSNFNKLVSDAIKRKEG